MAKPRTSKKKAAENTAIAGLLTALRFCAPASKEVGSPNQTHLRLAGNWAVAFDGVVAMGHRIDSDIVACPHTRTLITALSKCDGATQITQLGSGQLSIQSGRFRAFVPCLDNALLGNVAPDPVCAQINPAVVNALRIVGTIPQENAQRIMLASAMLRSGSAVATDGAYMMEAWHGIDLPSIIIPKTFINVLCAIDKPATQFGFSATSATFYFDDGSWVRSQLYSEQWPDVDRVLNMQCNAWPIPVGLKEALDKIADLAADGGRLYTSAKSVSTSEHNEAGASCETEGALPAGLCLNIDHMQELIAYGKTIDFQAGPEKNMVCVYGDNFRGMTMHFKPHKATGETVEQTNPQSPPISQWQTIQPPKWSVPTNLDDDIPL